MYCRNRTYENFKLKLCMCTQSYCFGHMYKVSAWNAHHKCDLWHCIFFARLIWRARKMLVKQPLTLMLFYRKIPQFQRNLTVIWLTITCSLTTTPPSISGSASRKKGCTTSAYKLKVDTKIVGMKDNLSKIHLNSLAPRRCSNNFKNIILKLIVQN